MVIDKLHVGAHGRKIIYAVCADQTETGDSLSKSDEYRAKEAIKKAATAPAKVQATA